MLTCCRHPVCETGTGQAWQTTQVKASALEAAQLRLELLGLPCIRIWQPVAAHGNRLDCQTAAATPNSCRKAVRRQRQHQAAAERQAGQCCLPAQCVRHQLQHIHPGGKDQHLQHDAEPPVRPYVSSHAEPQQHTRQGCTCSCSGRTSPWRQGPAESGTAGGAPLPPAAHIDDQG